MKKTQQNYKVVDYVNFSMFTNDKRCVYVSSTLNFLENIVERNVNNVQKGMKLGLYSKSNVYKTLHIIVSNHNK